MAYLWLTDFRVLRNLRTVPQIQPSQVVQTVPTLPVATQAVPTPPALIQPTVIQPTRPPSVPPAATVKPSKNEPRKVIRGRGPNRPEPTATTIAPSMPPAQPAAQPATGNARLSIASQPAAEIFINNRRVGTTIDSANGEGSGWLPVTTGPLTISLRRNGYRDYVKKISVAKGDRITLGSITLERSDSKSQAAAENRAIPSRTLTISSNRWPVSVSIIPTPDSDGPSVKFRMEQASKTIKLPAGRYTIRSEFDGEIKERRIDTSVSSTGITYTVEFSRPQGNTSAPKAGGREP